MNVILDLDETLINTHCRRRFTKRHFKRARLFCWTKMGKKYIVVIRPGLQSFLDWLFASFTVSIWTAATRAYAMFVVRHIILVKPGRTLLHIFSSRHCDVSQRHGRTHKDLRILYRLFPGRYTRRNTILVDDRRDVCLCQRANSYRIAPFQFLKSKSYQDDELAKLQRHLASLL